MKVLVVDDSERLRLTLASGLRRKGHVVDLAVDGREGLDFALAYSYDVIVMDLMMPRLSGLDLLARLRERGSDVHVLMLSAQGGLEDRLRGLDQGADDFLSKPFSFEELCARLQALVRRRYGAKNPTLELGPLLIDTQERQITWQGGSIEATPSEYSVLRLLVLRRGRLFTKDELLEQLYDSGTLASPNLIEVLVSSLRKKFRQVGGECPIQTRRRLGYLVE